LGRPILDMMKLCILTEYFDDTGSTPTILSNLTGYLREKYPQLSIDVIASRNVYRGDEHLRSGEARNGVNVIRLNTPKSNRRSTLLRLTIGMIFTLAAMRRLFARGRYDLVLVVTNPPAAPIAAQLFARIRGIPYVYLIHDLYPDLATVLGTLAPTHPIARFLHRMQRGWLHSAAKVVVLGRCMRDRLVKNYGLPLDRIEVITNWCDPSEIVPSDTSSFREQHGLDGVTVLYAGNFGQYQDFDDVLNAAARLRDAEPHITFVLVGGGAREADIRRRVAAEQLHNVKVFPLVGRADYPDMLAAADISLIVLAKGAEGVGVPSKFYNVLASGRPTIAVVAPNSEVALALKEGDCGVQVTQGDADRLAEVVRELAADPERRKRLGNNARQALLQQYTLQQVGDRFWKVFSEVANQGSTVAPAISPASSVM
jgi:glycosyltransferase involved in cell wall biosynthesis